GLAIGDLCEDVGIDENQLINAPNSLEIADITCGLGFTLSGGQERPGGPGADTSPAGGAGKPRLRRSSDSLRSKVSSTSFAWDAEAVHSGSASWAQTAARSAEVTQPIAQDRG